MNAGLAKLITTKLVYSKAILVRINSVLQRGPCRPSPSKHGEAPLERQFATENRAAARLSRSH
jgi:hypothetical protein